MTTTILDTAIAYRRRGLSLIPIRRDGSKAPIGAWKQFQSKLPTAKQVRGWFTVPNPPGIGVLCGGVSGGLEVLDFDAEAEETFKAWRELVNSQNPGR